MRRGILLVVLCGLAACPAEDLEEQARSLVSPSRADVMGRVYDPSYTVPGDFLTDDRAGTPAGYALHHVMDETASFELCSDDLSEALALEQADHLGRTVQGYFVEALENPRYFEIVRALANDQGIGNVDEPTVPGFARVFRCGYVDRTRANRTVRTGPAGTLGGPHLSAAELRWLSEYLWQFTWFWPAEKKVLQTFSSESGDSYRHTLVLALHTVRGDGQCDRIEVVDWIFSVDKTDGEIRKTFNPLYAFDAQLVDGTPRECP